MHRVLYRFLVSLATLLLRSGRAKDLEIVVLRHQLTVLRRQIARPTLNDADRTLPGAIAAALPRARRAGWLVTPDTLLRWHRQRIASHWTRTARHPVRPAPPASAGWPYGWHARTPPGATGASTVNSSGLATASARRPCGRSSTTPASTPPRHARR